MGPDENAIASVLEDLPEFQAARFEGYIDAIEGGRIYGWALDPDAPDRHLTICFHHGGKEIGRAVADRYREDLAGYTKGDGHHAFVFNLPRELRDRASAEFYAVFEGTSIPLLRGRRVAFGAPREAGAESAPAPSASEQTADFVQQPIALDMLTGRLDNVERAVVGLLGFIDPRSESNLQFLNRVDRAVSFPMQRRMDRFEQQLSDIEGFILRIDGRLAAIEARTEVLSRRRSGRLKTALPFILAILASAAATAVAAFHILGG